MVDIRVQADVAGLVRQLGAASKQVPYATALALTAVARRAGDAVTKKLPSVFDRPTPFTLRAVVTKGARKDTLFSTVDIRPQQASYLAIQETGGTETPEGGKAFVLPIGVQRDSYGNMPRGILRKLQGRKRNQAFVGVEHGIAGFWQRTGPDTVKLLAEFVKKRTYKPRFPYHEIVAKAVSESLQVSVEDAVSKAIATARK